jgi:hypothetical protein
MIIPFRWKTWDFHSAKDIFSRGPGQEPDGSMAKSGQNK